MNCPACGRGNPEGAAACGGCGAPLPESPTLVLPPEGTGRAATGGSAAGGSTTGGTGTGPGAGGAARLAPGTLIGKRYTILSLLGEGGMGAVYRARDHELERDVALKVIRPEMASRPEVLERFKREILLASQVTHRNVLRIHDLGEAGGLRFISMSYVEGENLKALLEREGPVPLERALPIIRQVAEGLQAAHEAGVVHRDLKPQNVLLDREGNACIADFGISRSLASGATMTETGTVLGTVDYMSPEQARGETPDHRGDLYSLGMMIYEILTGTLPFRADNPLSVMMRRVHQDAPGLRRVRPDLPPWIAAIAARALARDPAARYASAADLLRDLDRRRAAFGWRRFAPPRLLWAAAGLLALVTAAAAIVPLLRSRTGVAGPPRTSLAILPFQSVTGDPQDDWVRTGLPGLVRSSLLSVRALRLVGDDRLEDVLSGLKIAPDQESRPANLQRIASLTGAENVLTGVLLRAGQRLRIEATLTRVSLGAVSRGDPIRVEGDTRDALFGMADQLARDVRDRLGIPHGWGAGRSAPLSTRSIEALRLYNEGRAFARTGNQLEAARRLEAALQKDAGFVAAGVLLAEVEDRLGHADRAAAEIAKAAAGAALASPYEIARLRATQARIGRDLERAVKSYRELCDLSPNDAETYFDLAIAQEDKGDLLGALTTLRRTIALDPKHPSAHYALGRLQVKLGNPGEGLKEYNVALGLDLESGNQEGRATVLNGIGNAYHILGQYDDALKNFQEALAIRRRIGDRRGVGVALDNVAMIKVIQGRYDEAIASAKEELEVSREIGDQRGLAEGLSSLGDAYQAAGRPQLALEAYQESLRIVRETNDDASLARTLSSLGYVNSTLGHYVEAFFFMKEALAKRRVIGDRLEIFRSLVDIGGVEQIQGRYEEALRYDLEALSVARETQQTAGVVVVSANLATIHEDQGDYGSALELLAQAEQLARQVGDKDLITTCLTYLGSVRTHAGDTGGADAALQEALRLAREVDNEPLIAEILVDQAALLLERGQAPRATAPLKEAASRAASAKDRRLQLMARLRAGEAAPSPRDLLAVAREAATAGLTPFVGPARAALAHLDLEAGRTREAQAEAERAIAASAPLRQRETLLAARHVAARALERQGSATAAADQAAAGTAVLEEMVGNLKGAAVGPFLARPAVAGFGRDAMALFHKTQRSADLERLRRILQPPPRPSATAEEGA